MLRSRALARRLEGSPRALVAHPSRLAVKDGEHLRMTAVFSGRPESGFTHTNHQPPMALSMHTIARLI
jgi:hypothetical protein